MTSVAFISDQLLRAQKISVARNTHLI